MCFHLLQGSTSKTSHSTLLTAELANAKISTPISQMALHFAYKKKQTLKQNLNCFFFSCINNRILKGTLDVVLYSVLTNRLKAKALLNMHFVFWCPCCFFSFTIVMNLHCKDIERQNGLVTRDYSPLVINEELI